MMIEYFTKTHYGTDHKYVIGLAQITALEVLTGKKTIDDRDIMALKQLGHTVTEVLHP